MEVIPENQSGAIGASPLSPAAEKAIVSVDLDMPTKRTELVQKSVDEHNKQVAERRVSLADKFLEPGAVYKQPMLDLTYGGPPGYVSPVHLASDEALKMAGKFEQLKKLEGFQITEVWKKLLGELEQAQATLALIENDAKMAMDRVEVSLNIDLPEHWADGVPANFKTRVGLVSIKDSVEKSPGVPLDSAAPEQEATSDLHFGDAIDRLKRGMAVARRGWNGVGMFVYHVPANAYPAQTGVAKQYFGENALVPYNEYLAIKNVDGTVSTWVASINDMMAQDWYVVNVNMLAAFRRNPPVAVMEEDQVK